MDERGPTVDLEELAWDLQELRVSLFAQSVGVRRQVSVKRIRSAFEAIRRS
jgi:ATP-dependent helicase HrpA